MRLLALLVMALAAPAAAKPCHTLEPKIVTPAGTAIDQFGGVVVIATESRRAGTPRTNVVVQPYEYVSGSQRAKAIVTELAPGLAIYAPPHTLSGTLDLEDRAGHAAVRATFWFRDTLDLEVDAAPGSVTITYAKNRAAATFQAPPPKNVVALLVRDASSSAALPRSWVRVNDMKQTQFEIYVHDRCRPSVPATHIGDSVSLAWVDAAGRTSLWSEPITVAK